MDIADLLRKPEDLAQLVTAYKTEREASDAINAYLEAGTDRPSSTSLVEPAMLRERYSLGPADLFNDRAQASSVFDYFIPGFGDDQYVKTPDGYIFDPTDALEDADLETLQYYGLAR